MKWGLGVQVLVLAGALLAAVRVNAGPDSLDLLITARMKKEGVPGAQVAVVQGGQVVALRSYGISRLEGQVPVDDRTSFAIASITKAFIGVAGMQLVEEGKLDLSAPIGHYLQDLPKAWQSVTIRQLFNHLSGLPDIWDHYQVLNNDEGIAWARVKELPLLANPGEVFRYTQTNYVLLGQVIVRLSGMPFTRFVTTRQLNVVSMPRTGFGNSRVAFEPFGAELMQHVAGRYTDYDLSGAEARRILPVHISPIEDSPAWFAACNGMLSSAEDMARWLIALRNHELLKRDSSLAMLWAPGVLSNGTQSRGFGGVLNGYALGWETVSRPTHRAVVAVGGDRAALVVYPDDDLAVVILTNLMGSRPESWIDDIAAPYLKTRIQGVGQ